MTMENQEEILLLLERFTKSKQKDIPRELEDYLNFVARTGDTLYRWVLVKPLFREKLVNVITDFHHNTPSIADIPQCPNVDPFNFERMKRALLERLDSFNSAPFTVQRICELLTEPRKQYTRIDKFMRAVEKNILVVSTQEPGRRRSDSENGDSLDSIVNGDLEVNVDIEMDNEQFHLEADALLPDSSDPVSSLHSSLADVSSTAQRAGGEGGNEMNGGRVVGAFMNSDGGSGGATSPPAKSGLTTETHSGVIDTNENATDGDIATPLLEASLEVSPSTEAAERTEKSDEIEPAPLPENAPVEEKESKANTDEATKTAPEEEITTAREEDGSVEAAGTQKEITDAPVLVKADSQSVVEGSALPEPTAVEKDVEQTSAAAAGDDDEPQAKMVKYDDPTLAKSNLCTSVITAEVHASPVDNSPTKRTEDTAHGDVAENEATEPISTQAAEPVTEGNVTTVEASSSSSSSLPAAQPVGPNDDHTQNDGDQKQDHQQEHSTGGDVETVVATQATETVNLTPAEPAADPASTELPSPSASEMEASSVELPPTTIPTTAANSSSAVVASVSEELEMELATVAASAVPTVPAPAEIVVEEVDMSGDGPAATEMTDDDPKQEDNVMDIDESSVEMMDQ
uniref:Serine/threonine-protein phosphatase 4 regulatory subunit 2 n=1 Tax=Anopheles epiroticus TaxID=199890 RepID=A0A182P980_9DIPT